MSTKLLILAVLSMSVLSCASKEARGPAAATAKMTVHCQIEAQKLIDGWFKNQMAVGCEPRSVTPAEPYVIEDYACSVVGTGMNTTMNARMKFDPLTRECMAISNR